MSLAPTSHMSLCSAPPLSRTSLTKQQNIHPLVFSPTQNFSGLSTSSSFLSTSSVRLSIFLVKTSETESKPAESGSEGGREGEGKPEAYQEYEVEVVQPYGLKFSKGRDGGTYIDAIAPGGSADNTGKFTVGDKVIATSAVCGDEIWPAAEYGRTMYTIRQRIGPLLMRMQKRYGNLDTSGELTEKEIIRAERNSGVISGKLRDIQMQNYLRKKGQKAQGESDLRQGLQLYKGGKYEEALEKFESVLGSKPELDEASIASYNVACCYSKLNQIQAGISALEDALKAGFEDFKRIRTDPDLKNVRKSEEFDPLLKRFDESFINENAINAIKSIFGITNKKLCNELLQKLKDLSWYAFELNAKSMKGFTEPSAIWCFRSISFASINLFMVLVLDEFGRYFFL